MEDNQNIEQNEKTFTQADLERILSERLERERTKFADYETLKDKAAKFDEAEEANKTEIEKAKERADALEKELSGLKHANEVRSIRDRVANETGIPTALLTAETEEALRAQAEALNSWKGTVSHPTVPDGGEAHHTPSMTASEILAIKDVKTRRKMIEQNIDLFD